MDRMQIVRAELLAEIREMMAFQLRAWRRYHDRAVDLIDQQYHAGRVQALESLDAELRSRYPSLVRLWSSFDSTKSRDPK